MGEEVRVIAVEPRGRALAASVAHALPSLTIASPQECFTRYAGHMAGVSIHTILDRLHYLSAGVVCFTRGLNDTPKVVAAQVLHIPLASSVVAVSMVVGGLISARRVAETMSHQITAMNHGQGLTANLATAFLVIWASRWGLPVSTPHVSCGALFGIGGGHGPRPLARDRVDRCGMGHHAPALRGTGSRSVLHPRLTGSGAIEPSAPPSSRNRGARPDPPRRSENRILLISLE